MMSVFYHDNNADDDKQDDGVGNQYLFDGHLVPVEPSTGIAPATSDLQKRCSAV